MKFGHIATQLYNTPLLITPEKLGAIMTVVQNRTDLPALHLDKAQLDQALAASAALPVSRAAGTANDKIAVISCIGSLVHRSGGFLSDSSGLRSYQSLRTDLRAAVNDPDVKGIMFDVDSHGGAAAGLFDLVDDIYEARKIKTIYGHANQHAYSAAYAILSACDQSFVSRTSGAGSIGVIMQHVDQSKWNKKTGLKVTYIFAGKHKADFSSHQPLDDTVKANLQAEVEQLRKLFADTVDRNRNLKSGTALATEAGLYTGQAAVDAGLADDVKTWDEALDALLSSATGQNKKATGGRTMTTQDRFKALIDGNEDSGAALTALGYVNQGEAESAAAAAAQKQVDEATAAAKKETADLAVSIIGLCAESGVPDLAAGLITEGVSLEAAGTNILKEKADQDEKSKINSTLGNGGEAPVNTFVEHCKGKA